MRRYDRSLIGGYVAVLAAAMLIVALVLVFRGRGNDHKTANGHAHPRAQTPPSAHKNVHATAKKSHHRPVARPPHVRLKRGPLPLAPRHARPWTKDGTSYVAQAKRRWLAVYSAPKKQPPSLFVRNPDLIGSPRTFLVQAKRKGWVRVYLPRRPNGVTGWIRRDHVRVMHTQYRIRVTLHAHRLELWKGKRLVLHTKTVVGTPGTPTPTGMFFVTDLLRPDDPNGAYGPYAFNLSAFSKIFFHFAGGPGVVAIHGTNAPWLMGQSASHGCIRVPNSVIRRLARILPLGTPVSIRA